MMFYSPESRKQRAKFITNLDQKLYYANAFIQFLAIITKKKRASFDTLIRCYFTDDKIKAKGL